MSAHKPQSRISALRRSLKQETGLDWRGTDTEFTEFLIKFAHDMPLSGARDAFIRYYLKGESRRVDEQTGRAERTDSRFYQFLCEARTALWTTISHTSRQSPAIQMLGEINGR